MNTPTPDDNRDLVLSVAIDSGTAARLRQLLKEVGYIYPSDIAGDLLRSALGLPHPAGTDAERGEEALRHLLATKWAPVKTRARIPRTLHRRVAANARAAGMSFSERAVLAIKREFVTGAAGRAP